MKWRRVRSALRRQPSSFPCPSDPRRPRGKAHVWGGLYGRRLRSLCSLVGVLLPSIGGGFAWRARVLPILVGYDSRCASSFDTPRRVRGAREPFVDMVGRSVRSLTAVSMSAPFEEPILMSANPLSSFFFIEITNLCSQLRCDLRQRLCAVNQRGGAE